MGTTHSAPGHGRAERILELLLRGPASAVEACRALEMSQASFSRSIQDLQKRPDSKLLVLPKVGGARAPLYAVARQLPRCEAVVPVHRVDAAGRVAQIGFVAMLQPRGSATLRDGAGRLYDGLPPELHHAAPSGFIGRRLASASQAELGLPPNLKDWNDDHRVVFLCNRSPDVPGNLVFGNESLTQLLMRRATPAHAADARSTVFPTLALRSAAESAGTSSAGGEQPKFSVEMEDTGHVLVKYAKAGTRMAELLRLEHLALRALEEHGVAAATTWLHHHQDLVFLEVQRFDRVGRSGRLGVISAGAYDDEHFGSRDNWADFARRLVKAGALSEPDALPIRVLQAFSQLIGNTDTHFENLSLMLDDSGQVAKVAPAYDMLPMCYAPGSASGIDPALDPVRPSIGRIGPDPAVWDVAARAALRFWSRASEEAGLSEAMRAVARLNHAQVQSFVEPLVPPSAQA